LIGREEATFPFPPKSYPYGPLSPDIGFLSRFAIFGLFAMLLLFYDYSYRGLPELFFNMPDEPIYAFEEGNPPV